jgi:hypothetical protein
MTVLSRPATGGKCTVHYVDYRFPVRFPHLLGILLWRYQKKKKKENLHFLGFFRVNIVIFWNHAQNK